MKEPEGEHEKQDGLGPDTTYSMSVGKEPDDFFGIATISDLRDKPYTDVQRKRVEKRGTSSSRIRTC